MNPPDGNTYASETMSAARINGEQKEGFAANSLERVHLLGLMSFQIRGALL